MLEIIAIVMISINISKMTKEKGLSPTKYVLIFIGLWIGLEIAGAFIGAFFFPYGFASYGFALIGAIAGGIIGYNIAKKAVENHIPSTDILDSDLIE